MPVATSRSHSLKPRDGLDRGGDGRARGDSVELLEPGERLGRGGDGRASGGGDRIELRDRLVDGHDSHAPGIGCEPLERCDRLYRGGDGSARRARRSASDGTSATTNRMKWPRGTRCSTTAAALRSTVDMVIQQRGDGAQIVHSAHRERECDGGAQRARPRKGLNFCSQRGARRRPPPPAARCGRQSRPAARRWSGSLERNRDGDAIAVRRAWCGERIAQRLQCGVRVDGVGEVVGITGDEVRGHVVTRSTGDVRSRA